jgi:hypothetical protein
MTGMTVPADSMGPPAPHTPIPAKPEERPARRLPAARRAELTDTAEHMVRVVAADPVKGLWLREHGARLLETAAARIRAAQADAGMAGVDGALVVERLAQEHRAGITALW